MNSDVENRLDLRIYYSVPNFAFSDLLEINKIQFI